MNEPAIITRIAAKGDGVTAEGRHYPQTAPGDAVSIDGTISPGPHRVDPPCQHFGKCGGCQLQHVDEAALSQFVMERVLHAAEGQGIAVDKVLETHLSPPKSRRRATLHAMRTQKGAVLGFREGGSHRIIDLQECHILAPELFELAPLMRQFIGKYGAKRTVEIELTLVDQGVDCGFTNLALEGLEATEAALELAQKAGLARLGIDQGYGQETVWEPEPVSITLSGINVPFPSGAFLQATRDAEKLMCADAVEWIGDAGTTADLFAGLGTFAFALSKSSKLLAVEAARDAHLACKSAAGRSQRTVHAMHRDLFRNPLMPEEIGRFDAAVLDPPRAGAKEQVSRIAESDLARLVYVSCNPSSWARDAKRLIDAGFRLEQVRPIGQFRWSTHVELTSYFVR